MEFIKFSEIQELEDTQLNTGTYLCVLNADKIPPHIGICHQGSYFSIKVGGKDDISVSKMLRALKTKKKPCLFFELNENLLQLQYWDEMKKSYNQIDFAASTCLIPILDLFKFESKKMLLPDLLDYLSEKKGFFSVSSLNLRNDFPGIPRYTLEDVQKHILLLEARRQKQKG